MSVRRPLVGISGHVIGMPSGDTIDSATLENVITAGSAGDATHVPVLTWDAHGRLTVVTTAVLSASNTRAFAYFAS